MLTSEEERGEMVNAFKRRSQVGGRERAKKSGEGHKRGAGLGRLPCTLALQTVPPYYVSYKPLSVLQIFKDGFEREMDILNIPYLVS